MPSKWTEESASHGLGSVRQKCCCPCICLGVVIRQVGGCPARLVDDVTQFDDYGQVSRAEDDLSPAGKSEIEGLKACTKDKSWCDGGVCVDVRGQNIQIWCLYALITDDQFRLWRVELRLMLLNCTLTCY